MVGQQLTPELTQPNVLVEIDHGPPMRLRQEAQRSTSARELDQMTESWSIMFDASGPIWLQTIEFDGCLARRIAYGDTTASIQVESDGTKVEVLEGECAGNSGEFLTSRRPQASCALCAKPQPQQEEETAFVGMHHLKFMNRGNEQGARQYSMDKSSSLGWSHPEEVWRRIADKPATAVVPSPLGRASPASGPLTTMRRSLNLGSVTGRPYPLGHPRSLVLPLDQREELVPECGLEDHCFNSHGNRDNVFVILDKRVAEYPQDSVYGGMPQTTCRCDLPMRDSDTGRLREPQSTRREVTNDAEPSLPMAWAAGSKTNFSVDTIEVAREVFMWMIQYTMMNSQCERQSPLLLYNPVTELVLDFVAATISGLPILLLSTKWRNARVKQCTQEVHCLLDDPG